MSKHPIIGITANTSEGKLEINEKYMRAVALAGGVPVVLPYTENGEMLATICEMCDGFLFSGGGDIDPTYYGEEALPECGRADAERDVPEIALLRRVLDTDKPILAICRGSQLLNVALGGTLWQDIPSQLGDKINHCVLPGTEIAHSVNIIKDTPLYELIGCERIGINTVHHQAVKVLGDGLHLMAVADDGIIEGYYLEGDRYIRAYQWHPERIYDVCGESARIFADFVGACK